MNLQILSSISLSIGEQINWAKFSLPIQATCLLLLLIVIKGMQPCSKQSALLNTATSTVSFSQHNNAENSTCEHSLVDTHQHLTYTFGYPIIDQTALTDYSNKHSRKPEKSIILEASEYLQPIKCQPNLHPKANYQSLQMILRNQNVNLKQQNQLLLREIYRLKTSSKNAKEACRQKRLELDEVKAECKAQKRRGDEIMSTMMDRLMLIQQKFKRKGQDQSECSILDILNQVEVPSP